MTRGLRTGDRPDVVIFEGNYPAWPWLAGDSSGRLLCTFREDGLTNRKDSGHFYSPLGRAMLAVSEDGGRTWSPPRVIVDNPGYDDACAGIVELPDGTLLASYYSRLTAGGSSQAWVTRSVDGGETWGSSVKLSDEHTRVRGAPILLSNGDILVPIYRVYLSSEDRETGFQSMAALSSDGGETWRDVYVPNAVGGKLNEWAALEVEPGRLIGLHRDEAGETRGLFWKTESRDWGRTWSAPVPTNVRSGLSASPPHLRQHGDTVVLTYADARMASISMVTTADPDYVEWDLGQRFPCYRYRDDGNRIADASYTCWVATGPHRLLIVDYEIESRTSPDPGIVPEYDLREERKQITGRFVDTPAEWGPAV